jgi:hypothetical protein
MSDVIVTRNGKVLKEGVDYIIINSGASSTIRFKKPIMAKKKAKGNTNNLPKITKSGKNNKSDDFEIEGKINLKNLPKEFQEVNKPKKK